MTLPAQNPAPLAYAVHPGGDIPTGQNQQTIAAWMTANGINPNLVAAVNPITVLPIPYEDQGDGEGPWLVQMIVFSQFYMREDGTKDHNHLTRQPVTFQRTVPLRVPFPAAPMAEDSPEDSNQALLESEEDQQEEVGHP
jgi:hypothetical protein